MTAAIFLLAYRMTEFAPAASDFDNARLLLRLYLASLVLICIGAWWIVLSHESRELAERELVTSLGELTETRQELMQSERLATIGQLTATVSHELRNPLGTLLSSISVLRKRLKEPDPPVRDELDRMQRSIWRCTHIIEDLLEFSRNKAVLFRAVQIDNWIAAHLQEQSLPGFVRLRTDLQSGATVLIDGEKFRQAIVNLIQNAHQAIALRHDGSALPGELGISTRLHGDQVELRVVDNGCGINLEDADNIFKPLFSTKAFGVGLGLPLVQKIVERHDGDIDVQSEPGKGTVVTILLPVVHSDSTPQTPAGLEA